MKWQTFADMYVANWRGPWLDGGISEWIAKVERQEITRDVMESAIESCLNHRLNMAKTTGKIYDGPRLGEVLATYNRVQDEANNARPYSGGWRLQPSCGVCDGGYLWMVTAKGCTEIVDIRRPRAAYDREIFISRSLCTCQVDALGRPGELTPNGEPYFASRATAEEMVQRWEASR